MHKYSLCNSLKIVEKENSWMYNININRWIAYKFECVSCSIRRPIMKAHNDKTIDTEDRTFKKKFAYYQDYVKSRAEKISPEDRA